MRVVAGLALILLALGCAVPAALADGDPASDYLLSGSTFLSFNNEIPAADAKQLTAMLASAKAQGFPLKLAVIATPYDLGSVPILFNKPQTYSKFLGEEDFYYWKDELLVVMPKGYGLYKAKNLPAADKAAIAALPAPTGKNGAALRRRPSGRCASSPRSTASRSAPTAPRPAARRSGSSAARSPARRCSCA